MKEEVDCFVLDEVFRRDEPELWEKAETHATNCPACAEQIATWRQISAVAGELRVQWDSPTLWPRIAQGLLAESTTTAPPARQPLLRRRRWMLALAVASVLVLGLATSWLLLKRPEIENASQKRLLTEQALQDIEKAERRYVTSIENLFRVAGSEIEEPESELMMNYREKLVLLDEAIREIQANIERNRFNAHLRRELLTVYQEKQRTLEELVNDETSRH